MWCEMRHKQRDVPFIKWNGGGKKMKEIIEKNLEEIKALRPKTGTDEERAKRRPQLHLDFNLRDQKTHIEAVFNCHANGNPTSHTSSVHMSSRALRKTYVINVRDCSEQTQFGGVCDCRSPPGLQTPDSCVFPCQFYTAQVKMSHPRVPGVALLALFSSLTSFWGNKD